MLARGRCGAIRSCGTRADRKKHARSVEVGIAELAASAAPRNTSGSYSYISTQCGVAHRKTRVARFAEADVALHDTLVRSRSSNILLHRVLRVTHPSSSAPCGWTTASVSRTREQSIDWHGRILGAVAEGDPDLSRAKRCARTSSKQKWAPPHSSTETGSATQGATTAVRPAMGAWSSRNPFGCGTSPARAALATAAFSRGGMAAECVPHVRQVGVRETAAVTTGRAHHQPATTERSRPLRSRSARINPPTHDGGVQRAVIQSGSTSVSWVRVVLVHLGGCGR